MFAALRAKRGCAPNFRFGQEADHVARLSGPHSPGSFAEFKRLWKDVEWSLVQIGQLPLTVDILLVLDTVGNGQHTSSRTRICLGSSPECRTEPAGACNLSEPEND